jgi:hypothetical protein
MRRAACLLFIGAGGLAGCNPSVSDYCAPGTPECTSRDAASEDAISDAISENADAQPAGDSTTTIPEGAMCDRTKSPHDDPCVIDEAYGVFVSPMGSDANPGTRSAPTLTIGHGMELAKQQGKRVYVCAGSFAEQLVIAAARDGASVFGSLDCATWSYTANSKVVVAPSQRGYALAMTDLQTGASFEDMEFDAQNANGANAGESSIAVLVSGSQNVSLRRITMVAGNASDGSPGASPGSNPDGGTAANASNWFGTPPAYVELNGANAGDAGAPSTTCTCRDGSTSAGGQGGGPLNIPTPGAGQPMYGDGGAGAGGANASVCGNGGSPITIGADAPAPVHDIQSTVLGTCTANGWSPAI